jgi:DNA-binding transcriptional LysR family regulator
MDATERIERRLKLHDLRVLMSVVDGGSMGKAAKRLATSQPAVSRAIADLEYSLGVRLLDRGPHGIVPTPYGRALISRSMAAFDELRQAVKDIEFLADPMAGKCGSRPRSLLRPDSFLASSTGSRDGIHVLSVT